MNTPQDGPAAAPTPRELEVLALVERGLTTRAIAERLLTTPRTIYFHVGNLFTKLGARSRTEMVYLARQRGWLEQLESYDVAIQNSSVPVVRVCVFSGSSTGVRAVYAAQACTLGQQLSQRAVGLVYGGGSHGLMGAVAQAVIAGGGEVIGVIPQHLLDRGTAGGTLGVQRVVGSMHERKAVMADLADAFIAMPGGFGTLDELFEIVTWAQLGLHTKPIGLLNVAGYFDRFTELVEHAVVEGFIAPTHRGLLMTHDDPAILLDDLLTQAAQRRRPSQPDAAPILR